MLKYFLSSFIFFLSLYCVTAQHTNEEKILRARSIGIKDSTSGFQILDSLLPRLTKNSEFALYYKSHGVINYYWKKPLNALSLYERSILYYKKENNYVELCNTYNNIGLVYEDLNEADKAVYSFNQSMHFAEISGDVCCKTKASLNMANYYNKLHIISKCDEYSSKAVQYALLCKDSSLIVTAYNIRGVLFSSEKKKDSALVNYRISARYSYLINDQNNYAVALNNISHVFLSYNQYDSSSFYLLRSKDVFEQIKCNENICIVRVSSRSPTAYRSLTKRLLKSMCSMGGSSLSLGDTVGLYGKISPCDAKSMPASDTNCLPRITARSVIQCILMRLISRSSASTR